LSSPLAEHLPVLQQQAEDVERDAATLQDRARLLYEEIGSRVADRSNRSLSALTVISTLLLPPTFGVGAFGMNVGGIPWGQKRSRLLGRHGGLYCADAAGLCRAAQVS
jgi:zinc transporter